LQGNGSLKTPPPNGWNRLCGFDRGCRKGFNNGQIWENCIIFLLINLSQSLFEKLQKLIRQTFDGTIFLYRLCFRRLCFRRRKRKKLVLQTENPRIALLLVLRLDSLPMVKAFLSKPATIRASGASLIIVRMDLGRWAQTARHHSLKAD
jgi:hypothetical protein